MLPLTPFPSPAGNPGNDRDLEELVAETEERAEAHEAALWLTIVLIVAILL
jgi:hypothetical protein